MHEQTTSSYDLSSIVEQLQERGFAFLPLQEERYVTLLEKQLQLSASTFRFPPLERTITYDEPKRDVFAFLFGIARRILTEILSCMPPHKDVLMLQEQLKNAQEESLFTHPNEPFSAGQSFSGSFFNLFHYDYGCLNTHKDRYLVTVIAARSVQDDTPRSALWVHSPQGAWCNVDKILPQHTLVVLIGEELSALAQECGISLPASDHCIRVDPHGAYIPHSHHRRDPQTPERDNRRSIAFVLGAGHG